MRITPRLCRTRGARSCTGAPAPGVGPRRPTFRRAARHWSASRQPRRSPSTTFTASSPSTTGSGTGEADLSRRRIERAQDLLRSTNLTVTEVRFAVGFSSLGSFSSRFAQIVGESPRAFQQRYGGRAPRIPGRDPFMSGYLERESKPRRSSASSPRSEAFASHDHQRFPVSVWVKDLDAASFLTLMFWAPSPRMTFASARISDG